MVLSKKLRKKSSSKNAKQLSVQNKINSVQDKMNSVQDKKNFKTKNINPDYKNKLKGMKQR
jgi:hypothetical protein